MVASCIALSAVLSSRVDGWRIDGMDRWMDEWMAGRAGGWLDRWMDECPCTIDYKEGSRDRQGKSSKVMQTNGNVITFISPAADTSRGRQVALRLRLERNGLRCIRIQKKMRRTNHGREEIY